MKTTYVSAYYHIPKRKIPHMGIARYVKLAPETLSMISGSRLIFFYSESFIATLFERVAENLNVEIIPIRRQLSELPERESAKRIVTNARAPKQAALVKKGREKGVVHLNGMDFEGDRREYLENLSIWLSKIPLCTYVATSELSESQSVAWVDIGISKVNFTRHNWNFCLLKPPTSQVQHYASNMRYRGDRLPLSAGYLRAWPEQWERLNSLFKEQLYRRRNCSYPHDEETVLSHVVEQHPELFECVGKPLTGPLRRIRYYSNRLRGRKFRE